MWQMALSMKIFGVSEWAMRLPSALMGTVLVILLYEIVILLRFNTRIALISALLIASSNFHLQLISGIHGMDHNDVAHGFYVIASIWALLKYDKSKKWYFAVLVGIFSGAAILNKWLTGLLVYLIWAVAIFVTICKKESIKNQLLHFALSVAVCCIVFLPWQFYILHRFSDLAIYEFSYNSKHISEAVEGHAGGVLYYFYCLNDLFGRYIFYLFPFGVFFSISKKTINNKFNYAIMLSICFVFIFFSFIVKTKIDTYLFFVVPLALIYISVSIDKLITGINKMIKFRFLVLLISIVLIYISLNPKWFIEYMSPKNAVRNAHIHNAEIYRHLKYYVPSNCHVIMNMNSFEDIDVMFYDNKITAYHWTLSENEFKSFAQNKLPIAVFEPHGKNTLPEYVLKYPYLYIIHKKLLEVE